MPGTPEEDQFLEEVIGLFALEGQEWLTQIEQARQELDASPDADRAAKLWEAMRRGLTSIGGSAATVELSAIEQTSLALLSLVEALQRQPGAHASAQWPVFSEGLDRLGTVLKELAERKTAGVSDLEALRQKISDALQAPSGAPAETGARRESQTGEPPTGPSEAGHLVEALLALQQDAQRKPQPGRHLVDRVLLAVQKEQSPVQEQEARSLVLRLVQELEGRDQIFFEQAEERIPRVMQELGELKALSHDAPVPEERTGRVLKDIGSLKEAAAAVDATAMTVFCGGLETFIAIVARGRLHVHPQRFEAVAARLAEMRRWVFDWMETARMERTAIQHLLSR